MSVLKEFKEFAVKGDVVDMGVGIVIGAAFTSVVNSLVKDVFTPLLSVFIAGINFADWFVTINEGVKGGPYLSLAQAQADNAITLNIGLFLNAVISFSIVAMVLFFVIRAINRLKRPEKVTADPIATRECPFCYSTISTKAVRCPFCTAEIEKKESSQSDEPIPEA